MYEKYQTSLTLVNLVHNANSADNKHRHTSVVASWDNLFRYILDNFQPPETAGWDDCDNELAAKEYALCKEVLRDMGSNELCSALWACPPAILECVWPVAVARFLLRDCGVRVNTAKSKTFKQFVDVYGRMILSVPYPLE